MRRVAFLSASLLVLALAVAARAEVIQHGHFRVAVDASLTPTRLPRSGVAPVRFGLETRFISTNGSIPPQLRRIDVLINRHGRLDPAAVPRCPLELIQPATTKNALNACRSALVGEGTFDAKVLFTQQAPFPSNGKLLAFNGRWKGRPAILAHIYGSKPVPTSYTIPFAIREVPKGTFGTDLSASLPQFSGKWGYVTGITMNLGDSSGSPSRQRSYIGAGCAAPHGVSIVSFPLSRATFTFERGQVIKQTLVRTCRPR